MPDNPIYCLDTNFFINLKCYYFLDVFVSLKQNLEQLNKINRVVISKYVLDELSRQDDKIFQWVKKNFTNVEDLDEQQSQILHNIVTKNEKWTQGENTPADPFIIALAEIKGYTVVTHERKAPFNQGANNRIPAVCEHRGVKCCHTSDFFKKERWQF